MPKGNIAKSYAISDAKIGFVSLVDKAANKHKFLITKSEGDTATIQIYGRIVKADEDKHYVTGIVYEPMTEDTDGNYMTEEEITKAAHWFMKNSGKPDIQHCFEKADNVEIVESYVAKSDMEIEGQQALEASTILTNATSLGMAPHADTCPIPDASILRPELIVSDIIYNPKQTRLLQMASANGCATFNGLYMLLFQGAEAFRLWTGKEMPIEPIREHYFKD